MTLRELFIALGYQIDETSEKKAEQGIQNLKEKATQILGAIGIGFSLANLNELSEEFRTTNDQIAQGTKLLGDQDEIQKKILDSANRTRTSYAETANMVTKLVQENSELFGTVDEAIAYNDAVTMLFKTAGKTNDQISGLMESINNSFARGVVDTETISQLLEQSPEYIALLNERLGTTSDQLEQMVTDGKISLADLAGAVTDNADEIAAAFSGTSFKISDALLNIRNQFGLWVADMDESLGISQTIGTTMVKGFTLVMDVLRRVQTRVEWLAEKLGGTEKLFQLIGTIAASAFGVIALPKLLTFLTTIMKIDKALLGAKLKMLAIIAVVTLIALLIQDFISFMKGENSLIGELFDKAGIGAENARQTILQAWGAIKDFLLTVWEAIKQAAQVIFGALSEWWEQNGDAVMESFSQIWEGIKTLCITLWNALSDAAQAIFSALQQFWDTWGSTIITAFSGIWETVKVIFSTVFDILADIFAIFAALFSGDWDSLWEGIKQLVSDVWNGIVKIISTVLTAIWNVISSILSVIKDFFVNIFTSIRDFFVNIWNSIKDFFTSIVTSIAERNVQNWQAVKDFFVSIFTSIRDFFVGVWNGIRDTVSNAVNAVWTTISNIFTTIWDFISGIVTNIWNTITTTFSNILNGIIETVSNIKNSIVEGFQAAIDWITSLPKQALQWGADIIQGIVDGIKGAIGAIGDAVGGVAQGIRDLIGFSKPKKGPLSDFDTYMPDMIDLMSHGIVAGRKKIRDALETLTGDMSVMTKANVVSPGTAAVATGSNQVNKSVIQNVEINNKFEGDRAGQQKSSEAMDKAADDSTAELARALQYAR